MTHIPTRIVALTIAVSFAVALTAMGQDRTERAEGDRSVGRVILDGIEAGLAVERLARKVRDKTIEVRREWTGDPAPVLIEEEADDDRGKDKSGKDKTGKRGGGPPDWAPAHGWRAKFGEQQETELGHFAGEKVEEGLRGDELVIAIRREVDRISKRDDSDDEADSRGHHGGDDHGHHGDGGDEVDDDDDDDGSPLGGKGNKGKGRR